MHAAQQFRDRIEAERLEEFDRLRETFERNRRRNDRDKDMKSFRAQQLGVAEENVAPRPANSFLGMEARIDETYARWIYPLGEFAKCATGKIGIDRNIVASCEPLAKRRKLRIDAGFPACQVQQPRI